MRRGKVVLLMHEDFKNTASQPSESCESVAMDRDSNQLSCLKVASGEKGHLVAKDVVQSFYCLTTHDHILLPRLTEQ